MSINAIDINQINEKIMKIKAYWLGYSLFMNITIEYIIAMNNVAGYPKITNIICAPPYTSEGVNA